MIKARAGLVALRAFVDMLENEYATARNIDWVDWDLEPNYPAMMSQSESDKFYDALQFLSTLICAGRWALDG